MTLRLPASQSFSARFRIERSTLIVQRTNHLNLLLICILWLTFLVPDAPCSFSPSGFPWLSLALLGNSLFLRDNFAANIAETLKLILHVGLFVKDCDCVSDGEPECGAGNRSGCYYEN